MLEILFFISIIFSSRLNITRYVRFVRENPVIIRKRMPDLDKRNVIQGIIKYSNLAHRENSLISYHCFTKQDTENFLLWELKSKEYIFDYLSCHLFNTNHNLIIFLPFIYKKDKENLEIENINSHKVNYYLYFIDKLIVGTFYSKTSVVEDTENTWTFENLFFEDISNSTFAKVIGSLEDELTTKESPFLAHLKKEDYPLAYFSEYKRCTVFFINLKRQFDFILALRNRGHNSFTSEIPEYNFSISDILKSKNIIFNSILRDSHIKNQEEILYCLKKEEVFTSYHLFSECKKLFAICCDLTNIFNAYIKFKQLDSSSNDWTVYQIITSI